MAIVNREEIKRIAAEASALHGIRLDQDDPIMAVVTLNRLFLEQITSDISTALAEPTKQLTEAADRVQIRAGAAIAEELRVQTVAIRRELQSQANIFSTQQPMTRDPQNSARWQIWAAFAIFGAGVILGTLLR